MKLPETKPNELKYGDKRVVCCEHVLCLVQTVRKRVSPSAAPPGTPFPKCFMQVAKKILSRLFRVFVHVYIHHFDRVSQMGAEAHVNTCYKHFYYFVTEFNLTDHKELEPLKEMTARMCH
ncbi:MOB kinase activator 3A-like [Poecilia latipinna]|uniref:MOB kinase activator 3A-like n=1 Tax=Poecilia latipinna TaxID=48699 RepID=UPI00072E20F3|nr:PREDICTED: MOB kinase activator 3A-like [Poecilia latipinna]